MKVTDDSFIPLKINTQQQGAILKQYLVSWTPTLIILDAKGREHGRFSGFLPPQEFCARMLLEMAKALMALEEFSLATKHFKKILEKYKETFAAPEAIFYSSAAEYLSSHKPQVLKKGLLLLRKDFPDSEWTLRAKPYELIST